MRTGFQEIEKKSSAGMISYPKEISREIITGYFHSEYGINKYIAGRSLWLDGKNVLWKWCHPNSRSIISDITLAKPTINCRP